jgi:hypothetical protein
MIIAYRMEIPQLRIFKAVSHRLSVIRGQPIGRNPIAQVRPKNNFPQPEGTVPFLLRKNWDSPQIIFRPILNADC